MTEIVAFGSPLVLTLSLHDGNTGRFPRATVYNLDTGSEVAGSPFALTHVSGGYYRNAAFTPTSAVGRFEARYAVYEDSLFADLMSVYGRPVERFQVADTVSEVSAIQASVSALSIPTPAAVADAVWDELATDHNIANSTGLYMQVVRQSALNTDLALADAGTGLSAIKDEVINQGELTRVEVNANETKIDLIVPAITAAASSINANVDANELKIDAVIPAITAATSSINANVDANEVKIDSLSTQVASIQNNTRYTFAVPDRVIKPTAGSKTYQYHLRLYDTSGNPEAPDSTPTIRIRRIDTGVDVVVGVNMTQFEAKTGAYYYDHTITSGTDLYPYMVEATVVEGAVTNYVTRVSEITEFESDLNAIQAQLTDVETIVTNNGLELTSGVYGLAALKTGQTTIVTEINANETKIDAVKAKTDTIPANVATQTDVSAVNTTVLTRPTISDIQTRINLQTGVLKGASDKDLTQVYDQFDISTVAKTSDPRFANLDATVSSRSTLTALDVWGYATRTLTAVTLVTSEIKKIWDYLASSATVAGSLGKRIADFVDATVSSRATAAQVTSALSGVAQETTVNGLTAVITTEANENQILLNTAITKIDQVKAKTDNLPSDPASQSALDLEHNATQAQVTNLQSTANLIKAKTDNIPVGVATAAAVAAIPTNPLLANDARLNNLDATVSSRSTLSASSLTPLAKTTDVTGATATIVGEVNANEAKIDTANTRLNQIKAKTDNLPADPASDTNVDASESAVLAAVAGIAIPSLTPAQVWAHGTRTLTQDPNDFKADVSNLATKQDVLDKTQYHNRMSTVFDTISGEQKIVAWAEKDGRRVSGTACTVTVKNDVGTTIWTATLASPNADGIFKFTNALTATADSNYYVVISIVVDAVARVSQEPFITVG